MYIHIYSKHVYQTISLIQNQPSDNFTLKGLQLRIRKMISSHKNYVTLSCLFHSYRSKVGNILLLVNHYNQLILLEELCIEILRTQLFLVEQSQCEQLKISAIGALDLGKGFSEKQYIYLFIVLLLFKTYVPLFLFLILYKISQYFGD